MPGRSWAPRRHGGLADCLYPAAHRARFDEELPEVLLVFERFKYRPRERRPRPPASRTCRRAPAFSSSAKSTSTTESRDMTASLKDLAGATVFSQRLRASPER